MPHLHLIRRALRAWKRRRLDGLIPSLMEDFSRRDPGEVLDCADAVRAYYQERSVHAASPQLVRRRTSDCLRSGTCTGLTT